MNIKRYCVGFNTFAVDAEDGVLRDDYEKFLTESQAIDGNENFTLSIDGNPIGLGGFVEEVTQEEEGQLIGSGHIGDRNVFQFGFDGVIAGILDCTSDYKTAHLGIIDYRLKHYTIDNALMVLYALSSAQKMTLLMHASTVVNGGKAYLFLAPSGTGKSTQSQLWLKNVPFTRLLTDDNPVITINDGKAIVSGSPWSGKTPCYINESYPVGALVYITRAKYNMIHRMSKIEAYGAVLTSASGKRWDRTIADGIHKALEYVVGNVPIYRLECLPDAEAAKVCSGEVTKC